MVGRKASGGTAGQPNPFWWMTLGYAVFGSIMWLGVAAARLLEWRGVMARAAALAAQGNIETAKLGQAYADSLIVDLGFALGAAAIFAFAAAAVSRRTWNAWDFATVAIGAATVLTAVFICARGRIMLFIPISTAPLLALLYLPGTKLACNVAATAEAATTDDAPPTLLNRAEIEREIAKERSLITQLSQNLDVFEVERAMDTDVFVQRYTEGLEEETADNAEWFSIARAVRNSRRRLDDLRAQLDTVEDPNA